MCSLLSEDLHLELILQQVLILLGCWINKHLLTRQAGEQWANLPAAVQKTFIHPAVVS